MNLPEQRIISVFGSSSARPGDPVYSIGIDAGCLLADAGLAVATGGYGGVMEAVCRGAREAGGATVGITAPSVFPERTGANQWVEFELAAESLNHRLELLTTVASGFMALPGSLGTLAELILAWNLAFVAPFSQAEPLPIVAVGEPWNKLVPELATRLATDGSLVLVATDAREGVAFMTAALDNS